MLYIFKWFIYNGYKKKDYKYISILLNHNTANIIAENNENNENKNDNNNTFPNKLVRVVQRSNIDHSVMLESKYQSKERINDWYVCELLGKGGFGEVRHGIDIISGDSHALKFVKFKNKHKKFLASEIEALKKIKHKNIIQLIGYNLNVFNSNNTMMLVFEYAEFGELFDILHACHHFDLNITKIYFKQILDALKACHDIGIIHRYVYVWRVRMCAKSKKMCLKRFL